MSEAGLAPHRAYRDALGAFATGVTIVAGREPRGRAVAITVNSFASVSLDPPLVSWCLDRGAARAPLFDRLEAFGVSVLGADQQDIAVRWAREAAVDVADSGLEPGPVEDSLMVPGAAAWFACRRERVLAAGDHDLWLGRVMAFDAEPGAAVLTYLRGAFGSAD